MGEDRHLHGRRCLLGAAGLGAAGPGLTERRPAGLSRFSAHALSWRWYDETLVAAGTRLRRRRSLLRLGQRRRLGRRPGQARPARGRPAQGARHELNAHRRQVGRILRESHDGENGESNDVQEHGCDQRCQETAGIAALGIHQMLNGTHTHIL
jgi:hypothetical protein